MVTPLCVYKSTINCVNITISLVGHFRCVWGMCECVSRVHVCEEACQGSPQPALDHDSLSNRRSKSRQEVADMHEEKKITNQL